MGHLWLCPLLPRWRRSQPGSRDSSHRGTALPEGISHNEPEYVLRTELTDPNRYFAILTAIAAGKDDVERNRPSSGYRWKTDLDVYPEVRTAAAHRARGPDHRKRKRNRAVDAIESWIPCSGSGSASSMARKIDTNAWVRMPTTQLSNRSSPTSLVRNSRTFARTLSRISTQRDVPRHRPLVVQRNTRLTSSDSPQMGRWSWGMQVHERTA